MCDRVPLSAVRPSDYEKMPERIDSKDPLFNVGKKELEIALRMASLHDWVADWLFSQSSQIFHPRTAPIPPEAFENSLAIHLRHNISTPPHCPRAMRTSSPATQNHLKREDKDAVTVTKDVDLLLVPFVNIDGITTGYSFLKGVQEVTTRPPDFIPQRQQPPSEFVSGRFAFDVAKRDFLMIVNSLSPIMTGIVSMRWRDEKSRDRNYFAVPKADYGPGRLPSRVLSVQCQVEHEIPDAAAPEFQFKAPADNISMSAMTVVDSMSSHSTSTNDHPTEQSPHDHGGCPDLSRDDDVYESDERDFALQGDADDDADEDGHPFGVGCDTEQLYGGNSFDQVAETDESKSFTPEDSSKDQDGWPQGLESIGTVINPFDDPDGLLPELLADFPTNMQYMDDVEQILSGTSDILPDSNLALSDKIERSAKHARLDADEFALSPIQTFTSSPDELSVNRVLDVGSSWILSSQESTPDGVGIPRRPTKNDRSSGAFDMSALIGSLAAIERTVKGQFFGPKVRKDILHPMTGELISRCTGVVSANVAGASPDDMKLLRSIAAQTYYASRMSVSNDAPLIIMPPNIADMYAANEIASEIHSPTDEPRRKYGRTGTQKRPAPATLAPRPLARIAPPPGRPHLESLHPYEAVASEPSPVTMDEEAAREAKLEAKRIKNRLSAARSNQKRRAQLEAQKKELAQLRERVEELKSKQRLVSEENETLKRQAASMT